MTAIVGFLSLVWYNHIALPDQTEAVAFRLQILSGNLNAWSFTSAYKIVKPVFLILDKNLAALNCMYLAVLVSLASAVGLFISKLLKNNKIFNYTQSINLGLASCGIVAYAPFFVVEYNHLALLSTFLITALVFFLWVKKSALNLVPMALLGIFLGILTSVKVSAGFLLCLAIWGLMFFSKKTYLFLGIACQILSWWFLGETTGVGLFSGEKVAGIGHFYEYDLAMKKILSKLGLQNTTPPGLYLSRLLLLNSLEIGLLSILGAFCFYLGNTEKGKILKTKIILCIIIWVSFSILYLLSGGDPAQAPEKHNYQEMSFWAGKLAWYGASTALPVFLLVMMNLKKIFQTNGQPYFALRLLLLFAPFLCSFGTAFRLIHHSIIYSWMWSLAYMESPKKQNKSWKSTAYLISAIVFCQAAGANLKTFLLNKQNRNYDQSLADFPNGKYFRCSEKTRDWLLKIKAAQAENPIGPGSLVFCRGEYLASFMMAWKNPPLEEPPGKTRWAIFTVPPLQAQTRSAPQMNFRSLGFAIFGPPSNSSGLAGLTTQLLKIGYRKKIQVSRPNGSFTEVWEKPAFVTPFRAQKNYKPAQVPRQNSQTRSK